ncbi:MAG: glycosyltransferase [Nanoarchaeota archaeon]|nr:glycosyltransferase [Nanoarchaeota archaeon]
MKILHLIYDYFPIKGGYCYRSRDIFTAELSVGITPVVMVGPFCSYKPAEEKEFKVYDANRKFLFPNKLLAYRPSVIGHLVSRAVEIAKKEGVDVIHSHDPPLLGIAGHLAAKKLKIPHVHHIRGLSEESFMINTKLPILPPRLIEDKIARAYLLKNSRNLAVISNSLKEYFQKKTSAEITVIPNGVDEKFFSNIQGKKEAKKQVSLEGKKVLLFAGNARPIEGLELVIKSLPGLKKTFPGIVFVLIAGTNKYIDSLVKLAKKIGAQNEFTVLGYMEREKVREYLLACDIYVLPRRKNIVCELVTALKPLEPMACERIVLASDLSANRELIQDSKTGFLFEPENLISFSSKVAEILDTDTGKIEKAARKYVVDNRTWNKIGLKLAEMYDGIK